MPVLALAALLWGNCLSCPRMMLARASQRSSHGCCKHPKSFQCTDCQQHLRQFVVGQSDAPVPVLPVTAAVRPSPVPLPALAEAPVPVELAASPPLRLILDSCLRI
jgi:hypothetical protein